MKIHRLTSALIYSLLFVLSVFGVSCKQDTSKQSAEKKAPKPKINFKSIHNIAYTEIRREYDNRLGYNNEGYHLEPEWRITILSEDTVRIFSLVLQKFIHEPIVFDHDSVVSVAHSWLRVKKLTRDSLLFQVLYVQNQKVDDKSNIYMTLYSDDYIKNVLHTTAAELQKPPRRDTLFIRKKADSALVNYNKAFAATEPAVLISNNANVRVEKREVKKSDDLENVTLADNYLSPTFDVTINKAYAYFNYYMQVIVDEKGKLHFVKPLTNILDDAEHRIKIMKGVVDGYLTSYLKTTPGKTLGIPHASRILIRVKGIPE
jgi:hypothetical protein